MSECVCGRGGAPTSLAAVPLPPGGGVQGSVQPQSKRVRMEGVASPVSMTMEGKLGRVWSEQVKER